MVTFFPTPYPDEVLHSLVARYHMNSGNINYSHTIRDLFGSKSRNINKELPAYLGSFLENIPYSISEEELIFNHTLYPYYAAFKKGSSDEIKKKMISGTSGEVISLAGLNIGNVRSDKLLKHCPNCIEEDIRNFGETYWHRVHQVPGVFICPDHKVPLISSRKQLNDTRHLYKFTLANEEDLFKEPFMRSFEETDMKILTNYAIEVKWLLNRSNFDKFNGVTFEHYRKVMSVTKSSIFRRNSILNKELLNQFRDFYSESTLELFQSPLKSASWLNNIFRDSIYPPHPIRIILVILFLSGSITEFLDQLKQNKNNIEKRNSFGKGPWMCLNPVHKNAYKKNVIDSLEIKYNTRSKRYYGIFKCDCGFIYSRKAIYPDVNNPYKISRKVSFGTLWEKKLIELINRKEKLADISKKLDVKVDTIKRYAKLNNLKLGLPNDMDEDLKKKVGRTNPNKRFKEKLKEKRHQWLELIKQNEYVTTRTNSALYNWLRINDREWLNNNYKKKRNTEPRIFNWINRDKEMLVEVKGIISNWEKYESVRPRRITKGLIQRKMQTPNPVVTNQYDKIPLTMDYINSVIETKDEFALRKLNWAYKKMAEENEIITKTKLLEKASVSHCSKEVVKQYLASINFN